MIDFISEVGVDLVNVSASDDLVAMAAWVSNNMDDEDRLSDRERVRGLINFLYRNKHMSPFEHGVFTFKIDAPKFVVAEWQRHRTMSYNEVSGRYTEIKPRFWRAHTARVQKGKMGNYYFEDAPADITAKYLKNKERGLQVMWDIYQDNLASGMAKEQAREDMPFSFMTQFYATSNPRNLMQFLTLRNDVHALKEIRDAAVKVEAIFAEYMPLTYEAYSLSRNNKPEHIGVDVHQGRSVAEGVLRELKMQRGPVRP